MVRRKKTDGKMREGIEGGKRNMEAERVREGVFVFCVCVREKDREGEWRGEKEETTSAKI